MKLYLTDFEDLGNRKSIGNEWHAFKGIVMARTEGMSYYDSGEITRMNLKFAPNGNFNFFFSKNWASWEFVVTEGNFLIRIRKKYVNLIESR